MRKIVYTCIINDYDQLKTPLVVDKNWEYICFTTDNITSKVWKIVKLPIESDPRRKSRITKLNPNFNYDICIWVDASLVIKVSPEEILKQIPKDSYFGIMKHPERTTVKEEANAIIRYKKDYPDVVMQQYESYIQEGFPDNIPLGASGVIIRRNHPSVKEFGEFWLLQVLTFSRRDQMSFTYSCWKLNFKPSYFSFLNPKHFQFVHHKKRKLYR